MSIVQQQIQSTQQASVREQVIKKYDLLVEGVELMPICLSVLPKSQEKVFRIKPTYPLTMEWQAYSCINLQLHEYQTNKNLVLEIKSEKQSFTI